MKLYVELMIPLGCRDHVRKAFVATRARHIIIGGLLLSLSVSLISCGGDNAQDSGKVSSTSTVVPPMIIESTPAAQVSDVTNGTPIVIPATTTGRTPTAEVNVQEFFLSIESPATKEVVIKEPLITIIGSTRLDAVVTVNDKVPLVDIQGRFQQEIQLDPGGNIIEVIASSASGEEKSTILAVILVP